MLTNEQQLFLDAVKNSVHGTKLESIPQDIDCDELLRISKTQEMKAILATQILPLLKNKEKYKSIVADCYSSYASAMYTYHNRFAIIKKIDEEFTKAHIPYFVFKGTEIASFYDQPELRTMGDSDVLVHEEDRQRAGEAFANIGMTCQCNGENEWIYYYKDMEFELHCRLMNEDEVGNYASHKDFMNRRWNYSTSSNASVRYHLDLSYHFVFLLLHLRKHFINSGVGFRQFMDVAVMQLKCNLDWKWIEEKLTEHGIVDFAKTCFALIERWLEIGFPISANLDDEFYTEATEAIIANGVFGFDNEDNKTNYIKLQLKRDKTYKIKNALAVAFPSYETLRGISDYKFINGKPWLLPITWLYRFVTKIFSPKAKSAISSIKTPFTVNDSSINARIDTLRKWGINDI